MTRWLQWVVIVGACGHTNVFIFIQPFVFIEVKSHWGQALCLSTWLAALQTCNKKKVNKDLKGLLVLVPSGNGGRWAIVSTKQGRKQLVTWRWKQSIYTLYNSGADQRLVRVHLFILPSMVMLIPIILLAFVIYATFVGVDFLLNRSKQASG